MTEPRHSIVERMRAPMTLLMIAVGGFALYYSLFFERKTTYFRERNARLVGRLADQIRRSINNTARIVSNAAGVPDDDFEKLYRFDRGLADDQRQPQAIFDDLKLIDAPADARTEKRFARRANDGLRLTFEGAPVARVADEPTRYATATIPLQRLINATVTQTAGEVFDTVFILDSVGNVVYQSVRRTDEDSGANVRIVRLRELRVPRMFEKEGTLQVGDLMSSSRQMAVRIGDANYQLFSVPLRSSIEVVDDAPQPAPAKDSAEAGVPRDTWVICGVVSNAEFRSRSLAMSTTVLSCLGAAFLLTIFSWPFAKMAMTSPQHKVTLVDVVLIGVSGILAVSIVCLVILDWFTFRRLEATADRQLERLAGDITANFRSDIATAIEQLDVAQAWAEEQIAAGVARPRNANLLDQFWRIDRPFFQSFSLISERGRQEVKWSVDRLATPLTGVLTRRYFSAPLKNGQEYLFIDGRRLSIESIRSTTSAQPEVVFARRTADSALPGNAAIRERLPIIAMSFPSALSVIDPVLPQDFGFAIVDSAGTVLFHSEVERNTVENFFAETDDNPRVKAAVEARQNERMNIRYWGDDYRAYVQPMKDLPWTLITFREKRGLRTLNTEALTVTLLFLLAVFGVALLAFISLVLLLRPQYRAHWVWPDPARVGAYSELCGAYLVLVAVAAVLLLTLRDGDLLALPFWFTPLVLVITYVYLRRGLAGPKRIAVVVIAAALTGCLLALLWRGRAGGWVGAVMVAAAVLLVAAGTRAVLRREDSPDPEQSRERQTALPLCYVGAAFLLLLLTSVVPTTAFFKAAYDIELASYVKWTQMKLARDLQARWWRVSWEFDRERGAGKERYREARWHEQGDLYASAAYGTSVRLDVAPAEPNGHTSAKIPALLEAMLPRFSDASVKTRELAHDRAADDLWWWTRNGARIELTMKNPRPLQPFTIASAVPPLLPSLRNGGLAVAFTARQVAFGTLALLLLAAVTFAVARFVARRVFLVDLADPLWLSKGFLGLRHVICHPCDDASAQRLFGDFRKIDLAKQLDLDCARTAPQSFNRFEPAVFIDGVDYEFAAGERSELLRGLLDRLTRNSDRTVVLRPTELNVITHAFLQGPDCEAWAKTLSSFFWVNGSQLVTTPAARLSFSGSRPAYEEANDATGNGEHRWRWRSLHPLYVLSGFDTYFEQFTETRRSIERTLAKETEADPYLATLMTGLGAHAAGRDQLMDEISERAEEYYSALWRTCTPNEQLVLMQIAQTGLVNGKTRKHVRRLLARGLVRRDPQLRLMNETFRRFVFTQSATSALAERLEQNLAGDAWNRIRVPFFAAIAVVLLFFFTTQRQTFDSTIALVGGLAASLPAFLKTLSGLGERAKG